VHIRRALLLFAIVLGMAALVASLSRPPEDRATTAPSEEPGPGTVEPAPADNPPRPLSFDAAADETRRLEAARAATLEVAVDEPGSVEIPDLGLNASADEHTPARFELFPTRAGYHEILFTPVDGDESRPAGILVVTAKAPRAENPGTEKPLRRAGCPTGLAGCRVASGRVLYVERVDPDGDGDAHFVLASRDSITGPGISAIDVRKDLRPDPLPGPGDRLSAAGPVQRGSYGQRQIHALRLNVAR
jgi:hypothetical protein